jgi:hypothetical protein
VKVSGAGLAGANLSVQPLSRESAWPALYSQYWQLAASLQVSLQAAAVVALALTVQADAGVVRMS